MDGLDSLNGSTSTTLQRVTIISILQKLGDEDFEAFKVYLRERKSIPWSHLEDADRMDTSFKIRQSYPEKALDIIMEILKLMDRNDLVETFAHTATPTNDVSDDGESSGSSLLTESSQPPQDDVSDDAESSGSSLLTESSQPPQDDVSDVAESSGSSLLTASSQPPQDGTNLNYTESHHHQHFAGVGRRRLHTDQESAHFVMQHKAQLIQDVAPVMAVVDSLGDGVHPEHYAKIQAETTSMNQMRILYSKVLQPGGTNIRAAFYNALKQHQPLLLERLDVSDDGESSGGSLLTESSQPPQDDLLVKTRAGGAGSAHNLDGASPLASYAISNVKPYTRVPAYGGVVACTAPPAPPWHGADTESLRPRLCFLRLRQGRGVQGTTVARGSADRGSRRPQKRRDTGHSTAGTAVARGSADAGSRHRGAGHSTAGTAVARGSADAGSGRPRQQRGEGHSTAGTAVARGSADAGSGRPRQQRGEGHSTAGTAVARGSADAGSGRPWQQRGAGHGTAGTGVARCSTVAGLNQWRPQHRRGVGQTQDRGAHSGASYATAYGSVVARMATPRRGAVPTQYRCAHGGHGGHGNTVARGRRSVVARGRRSVVAPRQRSVVARGRRSVVAPRQRSVVRRTRGAMHGRK